MTNIKTIWQCSQKSSVTQNCEPVLELSDEELLTVVGGSGVLGLGDQGGSNRDESKNFNQVTDRDNFLSGQRNTFSPSVDLGGIIGVVNSLL